MAVNPLVVFVGLAVTTLGGLVAVVQQKNPRVEPSPGVVQSQPQTNVQNQLKNSPLSVPETTAPVGKALNKVPDPEKLANLEPGKKIEKKSPPTPDLTKKTIQEKTVPAAPTFDMVRVEKDGGAVVVGRAEPGADVLLKLNGKAIGQTKANEKGDWVFVPEQLIPQGNNELVIEATGQDKKSVRSKQSIFIAIPKGGKEKPLIVVTKPDAPTRVLQQPDAKPVPAKPSELSSVKTAKTDLSPPQPRKTEQLTSEQPTGGQPATAPLVQKENLLAPVASSPAAEKPVEKVVSVPNLQEKIKAITKAAQAPELPPKSRLTFGTVDYNDRGEIVFTGKAKAGSTVRLYVDNEFVGDAIAEADGNWVFRGNEQIKPGEHELRADQLNTEGKVAQRTAVPFVRANPEKVAALLETRKKTSPSPAQDQPAKPAPVEPKVTATPPEMLPETPLEQTEVAKVEPVAKSPTEQNQQQAIEPAANPTPVAPPAKIVEAASPPAKSPVTPAPTQEPEQAPEQVASINSAGNPAETASTEPDKSQPQLVPHVVIQPGNNLWNISRVIYGKGIAYTTIYQANQAQIKNPNRIYPGQIFTTPGTTSTGSIAPDQREPLVDITAEN
ncbi:hypothetical protein MNBD_ALPHA08-132 [hydrothermal vent metagenome]|uniref:LysM domain-containing protein n=1 Tax=hydrothermal vent metagenome TaxID=652676 RepID=A0A3B0R5U8_9ZZZZ